MKKLLSIILALLLVLTTVPVQIAAQQEVTHYSQMQYEHPDLDAMQAQIDQICGLAETEDADAILDAVSAFYDAYDWFYTCYCLADIRYSGDLTDDYWQEEYDFCTSSSTAVEQMLDSLNYACAAAPCAQELEARFFGEGFFDDYQGESQWDETLVALMDRENELISRYYVQSGELNDFSFFGDGTRDTVQTLVDLILIRNEIAAYCGYDSYEEYANDLYYYRDYTPEQMDAYLLAIQEELVPLFRQIWDFSVGLEESTEAENFAFVRNAAQTMGGRIWAAFQLMEDAGLYEISYSDNKYNSSFEVFLDSYAVPFLFMNPRGDQNDFMTLAHEFGHFANDYASQGSPCGIDVAEIFSQGMEYLALCYGEDTGILTRAKMVDSLCTYVEQACYASFERQMYLLEDPSVETLTALYNRVARAYGFEAVGYDDTEFVEVPHFYTNPMYVSSYIISNDAAMQLYQMEQEEAGSGLQRLNQNLDTQEPYFLAFLESAGLTSPFAPGRLQEVRETFETLFLNADNEESGISESGTVIADFGTDETQSGSSSSNSGTVVTPEIEPTQEPSSGTGTSESIHNNLSGQDSQNSSSGSSSVGTPFEEPLPEDLGIGDLIAA